MGWEDVNDLTWFSDRAALTKRCQELKTPGYSWGGGRSADLQLWEFRSIKLNDVIITYGKGRILGVGIVTGEYFYDNSRNSRVSDYPYPHRYKVAWLTTTPKDITGDRTLYGDPPQSYGTINTEDTIHKITDEYTLNRVKELLTSAFFPKG